MNVESYNHLPQKQQQRTLQEQRPAFSSFGETNYPSAHFAPSDIAMVGQTPVHSSGYTDANQLAPRMNKISLQEEPLQPHPRFISALRPDERNGINGMSMNQMSTAGSDQRSVYSAVPAVAATSQANAFGQPQFNPNVGHGMSPSAAALTVMTAANFPPTSQNGRIQASPFEQSQSGLVASPIAFKSYAAPPQVSSVPNSNPPLVTSPPPSAASAYHGAAATSLSSPQQFSHANHVEPAKLGPASAMPPPPQSHHQPPAPPSHFTPSAPHSMSYNHQKGVGTNGAYPPSMPPLSSHTFPPTSNLDAPAAQMMNRNFDAYSGESAPYPQPPHPSNSRSYPNMAAAAASTAPATPYNHIQPAMQPSMQGQHQRRLDPDQMPNPIQVMKEDEELRSAEPFVTNQAGLVPPLVTTKFVVQDEGNANPRFIRSTMYSIPCATDMMKQADVPFSLVVTPFATLAAAEQPPPVVNTGDLGPVRCVRCKAYVNSHMKFIDGGRRFVCVLCSAVTEVPAEYFQHLDHTGNRVDRYERPELLYGAYEFTVTKDYCKDSQVPNVPAFIFVIDVSYNNVKSGLVRLLCDNLVDIIQNHLPVDVQASEAIASKRIRVGFVTYDTTIHFYNIKACLGQPQMMIVGDTEDMFVPLVDGFLCDPIESLVVIDTLMRQIPNTFANTKETDTLLLPAVQAGLEALKAAKCSGKLLLFHSSLPTGNAPGKLVNREDRKLLATDKEKVILSPQNASYTNLAQECVNNGCSIDLFVLNNAHVDLATVGQLSKMTGGEIFKYTYFQADVDGERFLQDVKRNLRREIAFDAVMRVRTSTGVRPVAFYGNLHMSNTTDIELASINADKSVAVEVKHDDKLNEEDVVFVQVAILYTSCLGERRVRILNTALRTCSQLADLFRNCELDTLVNYWSKAAVAKLLEGTPRQVRESLVSRCVRILACYRKLCANPSSPGQLILPECMKLLPLYVNCLLKSDAISGGSDMTVDDRYFMMQAVNIMDIPSSVNYFYPRLVPLVHIDHSSDAVPCPIRCTSYKLSSSEAYLLENGIYMFLWLGSKLPNEWLGHVFGAADVTQINASLFKLPEFDNPLSKNIHSLIVRMQNERRRSMKLTIVREQDKMEIVFRRFLVEDGTTGVGTNSSDNFATAPYVDFLCQMHKEIRNTLS